MFMTGEVPNSRDFTADTMHTKIHAINVTVPLLLPQIRMENVSKGKPLCVSHRPQKDSFLSIFQARLPMNLILGVVNEYGRVASR